MATTETTYTLNGGSNGVEQRRLDFQHQFFLNIIHKQLIPDNIIAHLSSLGRAPAVADVATGTGIWISELAAELPPSARLDGYDFDTSKFIAEKQLPANVKLSFADALKPFPQEILGIYDLVHVRLLMFAFKSHEWEQVVANLRSLLRPGGYLLWEDTGYPSWQCLPMTESFMKWISLDVKFAAKVGRDIAFPLSLYNTVKDSGFINVVRQDWSSFTLSPEEQKTAGKILLAVAKQSMSGIVANGGFDWLQSQKDADELVGLIHEDLENGVIRLGSSLYWVVGQKGE